MKSLPQLFDVEVVHAGGDGLWVRLPKSDVVGFVPDNEISHAGVKASDGFFVPGDIITVSCMEENDDHVRPRLSRKETLDNPPLSGKGTLEVRIRRLAAGRVLAVAGGREVVLSAKAFSSKPVAGTSCTLQAGVVKRNLLNRDVQ